MRNFISEQVIKMTPKSANLMLALGGTGSVALWIEKATSMLGFLAGVFTCIGAFCGAAYWAVKLMIIWKNRNRNTGNE